MLVEHSKIDDQLAKIAATVWKRPQVNNDHARFLSKIFLACWRKHTRRLREVGARDRAWRTRRTRQTLVKAMAIWNTWLQNNRGVGAEQTARKALAEAKRLSCALHCFRDTCVRTKYRRHLKLALRILRTLTQRRPIGRAWCHWQNTVRHMQSKAVFKAWAVAARQQRQLKIAQQTICASKEVNLVFSFWALWRIRAGASHLTKLLTAWQVIGPVRRAIEILRDASLEARAAQQLRHRRLRNGLNIGFAASVVGQRRSKHAAVRARGHCRFQALRIHRWLIRHRLAQSVVRWQHRVEKARQRASLKTWASMTVVGIKKGHRVLAMCVRGLEQNAVRGRVTTRAMATAAGRFRHVQLCNCLKRWRSRTTFIQKQQQSQDKALEFCHVKVFKQGLECFNRRTQAAKEFRAIDNTRSARLARSFSASLVYWRKRASRSSSQLNLESLAGLHFRYQSSTAGHTRATYITGIRLNIRIFQLTLGLTRLRRRVEKRRVIRLGVWRAGVWAEAFVATGALEKWRRHARAQREIETSVRIARSRSQTRKPVRARCSPPARTSFEALKHHARARKLERRVVRAWASYAERATLASKQARAFRLRSGLRRLHLWVRRSECHRDRRLKALVHRNHAVVHAKFSTWKNKLYPLGLRAQRSPRTYPCTNAYDAVGTKGAGTHQLALRSQEMGCLKTTEAAKPQNWRGSSRNTRLALLRLPMVRRRLRRTLFVWRKQTEKEMRFRYIKGALPHKVAAPVEANEGLANLHDYLNSADAAPARIRRCHEGKGNPKEPDFKRPGRRVSSKGYLHLHHAKYLPQECPPT